MESIQSVYVGLSQGTLIHLNVFGEPFFDDSGTVFKVSPETGDREEVCPTSEFNPVDLDDYWTGESLKQEWEKNNGNIPDGNWLVPITPFVLGGKFEIANLMSIPVDEAIGFYETIRNDIKDLPDGATVQIVVKP